MKYLKISSLLVLSLLLFAPAAQAAVDCNIGSSLQEIRMESMNEALKELTVTCTWGAAADIVVTEPADRTGSNLDDTKATGTKFDLELDFNGDLSNDDDSPPTLMLMDLDAAATGADHSAIDHVNDKGYRIPAPAGQVAGSSVFWPGVVFPANWDTSAGTTGDMFKIAGIMIDASSVDDDRLEVTMVMTGENTTALGGNVDVSNDDVRVARVKQALDLEFAEGQKVVKFNACNPDSDEIAIRLVEVYPKAWTTENDILLMTSSGTITAKDQKPFDVIDRTEDDELTVSVTQKQSANDSGNLTVEFTPEAGGGVGDNITLTAMLLPARGKDESFTESADLVVGTYDACKGDMLTFPFISNSNPFNTGIAIVNTSEHDGECELRWDGMKAKVGQTKDVIDVDGMETSTFILSETNASFQGFLKAMCTFGAAYGYAYITDYSDARSGAQGYVVMGEKQ